MEEGKRAAVWVGTDRGLGQAYLNPKLDPPIVIASIPPPLNGEPPHSPIVQLAEDSRGILWMATRGEGLISWDPGKLVIEHRGASAGLEPASGIVPAGDQNIGVRLAGVAVGPDDRIFVKQGGVVYDLYVYPGRPWWVWPLSLVSVLAVAALLVVRRRLQLSQHPMVRTLKQQGDLSSVPLNLLPDAAVTVQKVVSDLATVQQLSPERWQQVLALAIALEKEDSQALATCFLALTRLVHPDVAPAPEHTAFVLHPVTLVGTGLAIPRSSHTLLFTLRSSRDGSSDPVILSSQLAAVIRQTAPSQGQPALVIAPMLPSDQVLRSPLGRSIVILREPELRHIAWSPDPLSALAALILQRSALTALCPYTHQGPVEDTGAHLFFGRERELRELLAAESLLTVVVDPRRVGKSSLLLAVQRALRIEGRAARYLTLRNMHSPGDLLALLAPDEGNAGQGDPLDALHSLLSGPLADTTLLLDEADALMCRDAEAGHPLADTFRALVQQGTGRVVLAGYWDLYRLALDYRSPFYNLGRRVDLGPLERPDALGLARQPMEAAGYRWAHPELPEELVDKTGGYPSLVQHCCSNLMMGVRGKRPPVLVRKDLDALWGHANELHPNLRSYADLQRYVLSLVDLNLDRYSQVVVLAACQDDGFTRAQARQALIEHLALPSVGKALLDETLLRLQLYGAVRRDGDVFYPRIPLLWEILRRLDREDRLQELREE
jgi:hypothetical protein